MPMSMLSREQQVAALQDAVEGPLVRRCQLGLVLLFLVLLAAGLATRGVPFLVVALFSLLMAWVAGRERGRLQLALRGLQLGRRLPSEAWIEVGGVHGPFHATVGAAAGQAWRFAFQPDGWRPAAGALAVEIVQLDGAEWPVLLLAREGLLVPGARPRPIAAALPCPAG